MPESLIAEARAPQTACSSGYALSATHSYHVPLHANGSRDDPATALRAVTHVGVGAPGSWR